MSFPVLEKKRLNPEIVSMEIYAPDVIVNARPGQFVVLKIHEKGERIPLTIVSTDAGRGSISVIFQEAGKTTRELGTLEKGQFLSDVIGPLGKPTHIMRVGKVVSVGGGVGTAEIYPVTKAFREAGNDVISIVGARDRNHVLLVNEIKKISDEYHVATDDGSAGEKGFVTDILRRVLPAAQPNLVYAVGPIPMMSAVSLMTKEYGIKTIVSLNANMMDGTGMCGTCRVTVGGETRFTCVDGPDFDAHEVDFTELMHRSTRFIDEERVSLNAYEKTRCEKKNH